MSRTVKEKKLLMSVVAALLAMTLTCISFIGAVLMQLPASAVNRKLEASGYFEDQAKCLEERILEVTEKAGLPGEIVEGIFTTDEILNITKEYTLNMIRGYDDELNQAAVEERLRERLYSYLEKENISKSRIDMESLKNYLSQSGSVYQQTVDQAFVLYFHEVSKTVSGYCLIAIAIMVIFAVSCIIFIYMMTKMRRKTLSYVIRSMTATVVLTGIPSILALYTGWHQRINVHPEFVLNFAKVYINGTFKAALMMCLVWLAVIAACSIAIGVISNKKKM